MTNCSSVQLLSRVWLFLVPWTEARQASLSITNSRSHTVHGENPMNTEVVCHSLLHWTTFCQTSPPWPTHLGWPHRAWLSFIELDQALVLGWLDWLVFCEYGFSVSALWCPLATPTVLLGFSYLGCGVSLHSCSSKVQPLLLTLDEGYLLTAIKYTLLVYLKQI